MSVIALPNAGARSLKDLGRLQDIPAVRQLGLLGVAALAIALGLWLFFWTQEPAFVPLQAGLDAKSTSEASDLLRTQDIPFRIEPGSGALAVPADRVGEARLALAGAGLTAGNGGGFATIEGDQGFGTSQFVENARYQHALEVELARTIGNLRPVREARVHLALPKPSAFTRQREPASASVVLQLQGGASLEQRQVDAIVRLVASSIPDLAPERVTVVDQFGRLLSTSDPGSDAAVGAEQFEQQRRQEAMYVQRIHELLEPMTGPGRVSAQVSVDMNFDQTEQAREVYGPQGGQVRSEQVSESGTATAAGANGGGAPAQGIPGSASNTPEAAAATTAAATAAAAPADDTVLTGPTSRSAVRNYEIDRTLTHTRNAPGSIRRVTAAVLVDHVAVPGKDGAAPAARALTAEELKRIETLVQQAVGFDAQRGDAVSVVNAPFARHAAPGAGEENAGPPAWKDPRVRELLRIALGGLAVLLVVWFVLRPAFRQLLQPRAALPAPVEVLDEDVPVVLGTPSPHKAGAAPVLNFDDKLQVARNAVNTDSKRVAQVVRDWVATDG